MAALSPKTLVRRIATGAILGAVFGALGFSSLVDAASARYRLCSISNGQVFSCGSWYQGTAVVERDGAYRECTISNGEVFSCTGWYQGKAVVRHDGAYRECSISNGRIFSCGSWYQGDAVVRR